MKRFFDWLSDETSLKMAGILTFTALFIGLGIFTGWLLTPKEFNGFYLSHNCRDGAYVVYINWDNAVDEAAFRTYDGDKAIAVLKELQEMEAK